MQGDATALSECVALPIAQILAGMGKGSKWVERQNGLRSERASGHNGLVIRKGRETKWAEGHKGLMDRMD
jgi:hypothetical protein